MPRLLGGSAHQHRWLSGRRHRMILKRLRQQHAFTTSIKNVFITKESLGLHATEKCLPKLSHFKQSTAYHGRLCIVSVPKKNMTLLAHNKLLKSRPPKFRDNIIIYFSPSQKPAPSAITFFRAPQICNPV